MQNGLHPADIEIAGMLRKNSVRKIILVANKIDTKGKEPNLLEFYSLGIGILFLCQQLTATIPEISLDEITRDIPQFDENEKDDTIKFALIGKPNAGKSSIVKCTSE